MIKVFVDESGDLGIKQRFFIIALLIPKNSKRIRNIIKHHCARYGLTESKASQLSLLMKQEILDKLSSVNDYDMSYIVADKQAIMNERLLLNKNILFNYLFQLLLRPIIESAEEDISILLDNRTVKPGSINSLADYIKTKAYTEWGFSHELRIDYIDSKNSKEVQMVDLIANIIYNHYVFGENYLYKMIAINTSIAYP